MSDEALRWGVAALVGALLVLRLRHQLHQERWTGKGYEPLPDLLVEECLTARVNGDGLEQLEGASALELLEAPASGNIDPGQRQQWLEQFHRARGLFLLHPMPRAGHKMRRRHACAGDTLHTFKGAGRLEYAPIRRTRDEDRRHINAAPGE